MNRNECIACLKDQSPLEIMSGQISAVEEDLGGRLCENMFDTSAFLYDIFNEGDQMQIRLEFGAAAFTPTAPQAPASDYDQSPIPYDDLQDEELQALVTLCRHRGNSPET